MHLPTKEVIDKLLVLGDAKFTSPIGKYAWGLFRAAIIANEAKIIDAVDNLHHKLVEVIVAKGDDYVASTPGKIDDMVWNLIIKPFLEKTVLELQAEPRE